jgi:hypothetical protein
MLRQGHQGMKRKRKQKIKKQEARSKNTKNIQLLFIGLILRTVLSILIQALSCDN